VSDDLSVFRHRGLSSLSISSIPPRYLLTLYLRSKVYSGNQAPRISTSITFPHPHLRHVDKEQQYPRGSVDSEALASGMNARQAARVHTADDVLPHLRGCGLQYAADRTDLRRYFTHAYGGFVAF